MYCDWPRLARCCFCMPLRKGVLTYAYINIFYSAFILGLYCYNFHYALMGQLNAGRFIGILPTEVCIVFFCFELLFNALLIYGAHKKLLKFVKTYYFYSIVTCIALFILQIVDIIHSRDGLRAIEKCIFSFAGLFIQVYLLILVRSLIQDLKVAGPHTHENQLHPIANGGLNVDSNGIYHNTTVIPINT